MNKNLLVLAAVAATINEALPTLAERLPSAQVQKFRDLAQDAEAAAGQGLDVTLEGEESELQMPKEIAEVLTAFNAELTRRAEFDKVQEDQTDRVAKALEQIVELLRGTAYQGL